MKGTKNIVTNHGLYDRDVTIIKRMGNLVKIANLSACRHPGLVIEKNFSAKGTVNDEKLENNISRTKSTVREIALCNEWKYFITLTLNRQMYDRYNLPEYVKGLGNFIKDYNRYCKPDEVVKYLLIPELHLDNAWHMHGFVKGIKEKDLFINSNGYLSWRQYANKFGWMSLDKIRSIEEISSYIMKYISKGMGKTVSDLGSHLYYPSHGLKRADLIYKGTGARLLTDWDYETPDGYCRLKYVDERFQNLSDVVEVEQ